jgi:hypothetical protein
MIPSL